MAWAAREKANSHTNLSRNLKKKICMYRGLYTIFITLKLITPLRFSEVFFVDATTKETIKADLEALSPPNVEPSINSALHWLTSQRESNWLLIFNNADDTKLNLGQFFPQSRFGNILITTRNQKLLNLSTSSERLAKMDPEDAIKLLMNLSNAKRTDENEVLVAQIVEVFILTCRVYETYN